jgi:hypothetical protein
MEERENCRAGWYSIFILSPLQDVRFSYLRSPVWSLSREERTLGSTLAFRSRMAGLPLVLAMIVLVCPIYRSPAKRKET